MREKPKLDLGLTAYDDLFKNDTELAESRLPKIYDIPIELIDDLSYVKNGQKRTSLLNLKTNTPSPAVRCGGNVLSAVPNINP